MKPFVIGLSGKRGSGKTSVSQVLASRLNVKLVQFSQLVKTKALVMGYSNEIDDLQIVGELLAKNPNDFCQELLSFCNWNLRESLIIDGIRHLQIVNVLKESVSPCPFFLISITLDETFRYERLIKRDNYTKKQITEFDSHSTEQQIELLIQESDLVVNGNHSVETIVSIIIDGFQKLTPK
jgi:dephospho-CoA kinase